MRKFLLLINKESDPAHERGSLGTLRGASQSVADFHGPLAKQAFVGLLQRARVGIPAELALVRLKPCLIVGHDEGPLIRSKCCGSDHGRRNRKDRLPNPHGFLHQMRGLRYRFYDCMKRAARQGGLRPPRTLISSFHESR